MLSILPKHVADEMLKDMKKDPSQKELQQFNTMYMYRHENVRCRMEFPPGKPPGGKKPKNRDGSHRIPPFLLRSCLEKI